MKKIKSINIIEKREINLVNVFEININISVGHSLLYSQIFIEKKEDAISFVNKFNDAKNSNLKNNCDLSILKKAHLFASNKDEINKIKNDFESLIKEIKTNEDEYKEFLLKSGIDFKIPLSIEKNNKEYKKMKIRSSEASISYFYDCFGRSCKILTNKNIDFDIDVFLYSEQRNISEYDGSLSNKIYLSHILGVEEDFETKEKGFYIFKISPEELLYNGFIGKISKEYKSYDLIDIKINKKTLEVNCVDTEDNFLSGLKIKNMDLN